jgi:hypothetical protein
MMDAVLGDGTAARMHKVEGAEEMMDQCAAMMAMMGDMDMSRRGKMMRDGGMMDQMMDGRGMSAYRAGGYDGRDDGVTLTARACGDYDANVVSMEWGVAAAGSLEAMRSSSASS